MSFLLTTYDFRSPSGMHIFHLANALTEQHVNCVTYSIDNADTVPRYGQPTFRSYDQETSPYNLAAEVFFFLPGETIVHCWTPRESSRIPAEGIAAVLSAP